VRRISSRNSGVAFTTEQTLEASRNNSPARGRALLFFQDPEGNIAGAIQYDQNAD
jgi:hypothetical protein